MPALPFGPVLDLAVPALQPGGVRAAAAAAGARAWPPVSLPVRRERRRGLRQVTADGTIQADPRAAPPPRVPRGDRLRRGRLGADRGRFDHHPCAAPARRPDHRDRGAADAGLAGRGGAGLGVRADARRRAPHRAGAFAGCPAARAVPAVRPLDFVIIAVLLPAVAVLAWRQFGQHRDRHATTPAATAVPARAAAAPPAAPARSIAVLRSRTFPPTGTTNTSSPACRA